MALDLLAEKQLRRIHQTTLSTLEPENPNYDILKILNDESLVQKSTLNDDKNRHYSITPFWQLNCEAAGAIPKDTSKEKNKPYVIPSKIQKGEMKTQPRMIPAITISKKNPYRGSTSQGDSGETNRPKSSSLEAFTMALTPFPQFQFGTNKPLVPQSQNLFKFGESACTSGAGAFRNENSNSQNGFQLLLNPSQSSSSSPKNNFLVNTNRYRDQIASPTTESPSTVSSSSSKKFSFAQKISDR